MDGRKKAVGRKRKEEEAISSSVTVSVEDYEVIKCVRIERKILTWLTILKNKLKRDT